MAIVSFTGTPTVGKLAQWDAYGKMSHDLSAGFKPKHWGVVREVLVNGNVRVEREGKVSGPGTPGNGAVRINTATNAWSITPSHPEVSGLEWTAP